MYIYIMTDHSNNYAITIRQLIPMYISAPDHSPGWLWCAVTSLGSLSPTEPYLRLIGSQQPSRLQRSRWHGNVWEKLGLKGVVIGIVRISEAGTAVSE